MIHLILAEERDLATIARIAGEIWNMHYVPMIGQEQVDYMLGKFYSHASLIEQLGKGHCFYLITNAEGDTAIGFLSVSKSGERDYFLHKLYIYDRKANAGAGTETLHQLIRITDPKTLTLTVNRKNYKSVNFYFKNGFKIKSVEDFDIGNGYEMNDFVMERKFGV